MKTISVDVRTGQITEIPYSALELAEWELAINSLPALKASKKAAVTALRKSKELLPVTIGGVTLDPHNGPLMRLIGAKVGNKASRKFVTESGQRITATEVQFDALFTGVDNHLQALSDREYDLHEAIDAAADKAALDVIDINVGWPT